MDHPESLQGKSTGRVLFRKRYQVSFEFEAEYREMPIHPDDAKTISMLRDLLLSDEEMVSRLLLSRCIEELDMDHSKLLKDAGFSDSTANKIVESKARLLPGEAVAYLLSLYIAGLGFADDLSGDMVHCRVSDVRFFDADQKREITMGSEPEPLFHIQDPQGCLLAKTETEWIAALTVQLNYAADQQNAESLKKALRNLDQIDERISGSDLPLRQIEIGIIASEEAEFAPARIKIEGHIQEKMPQTKIQIWFRQEQRFNSMNIIDLIRMSKTQGAEKNQ